MIGKEINNEAINPLIMNDKQDKILKEVIKEIEKQYGKGSIMQLSNEPEKIDVISSGSLLIDQAIGVGGFPKGRITEIYGPESSGKTTIALHAIAEAQKKDGIAAFIDAEHALDPRYAKSIGVNINDLIVSQPDSGEQALDILEALIKSNKLSIIVVDSVATLVPKAELEGEMSDQLIGAQARMMSKALRKINGLICKTNIVVLFINQLREKVGIIFGNPETTSGGRALRFYSSLRMEVRRGEQISNNGQVFANKMKVKIVKNKVAAPFKTCQILITYDKGIDKMLEVIELAIEKELIKRSGTWFYYNDEKIGQGKEAARKFLLENPKIYDEILTKLI